MALPAGWYPVAGDPSGTHRYWDGEGFTTGPKRDVNSRAKAGFAKPNSAGKWRMATLMSRLTAGIIDLGAPAAVVLGVANGLGYAMPGTTLDSWLDSPGLLTAIFAALVVNEVLLVGLWGVSVGRTLLGLRVVDYRDKDRAPGLPRAAARFLLAVPGIPVSAVLILLGKRRGMHDFATGTAVVYV